MSLKGKLTKMEKRLGRDQCPHCHGFLPSRAGEEYHHPGYTEEERLELIEVIFKRFYTRDTMLKMLAGLDPELRREIVDVYPVSHDEQRLLDMAAVTAAELPEEREGRA